MNHRNINSIFILMSFISIQADFNDEWYTMQESYKRFKSEQEHCKNYNQLVHPDWQKKCRSIVGHIMGSPKKDFLMHPELLISMIRSIPLKGLVPEEDYLINHVSESTKQIINNYKDMAIGGLQITNARFNCTGNSRAQLFHFAKLLELNNKGVKKIVEFGGGFGNLARIAKMCIPKITYILIDLPEICAIQSLYLNVSLPNSTKVHYTAPLHFEPGFIHIVPVYLLKDINIAESDAFISTFALTESPNFLQQIIFNKQFFNSNLLFLVGLVVSDKWIDINSLINNIKIQYSQFHKGQYQGNNHIFEAWGLK